MIWTDDIKKEVLEANTSEKLKKFCSKYKLNYSSAERARRRAKKQTTMIHGDVTNINGNTALFYESQIRSLNNEIKGLKKQVGFERVVKEVAEDKIVALPKIKLITKRKSSKKVVNEVANLILSDLHIGEIVRKSEMGGINEYDFKIFTRRMEQISNGIFSIKNKMQGYDLKHLEIHALGDFVSGLIHDELLVNGEETIIENLFKGASVISQFLSELLTEFNSIHFTGIYGNHGRMFKKPQYKRGYINFDHILYRILELMMKDNNRITFHNPESFWNIRDVGGRKLLQLHGSNIRGWNGIPHYGIQRATAKLTELLTANNQSFDDCLLAHFHSPSSISRTKGEVLINGSVIGSNEFSVGGLFVSTEPSQLFFGINPKHKRLTWKFNIDLRDISETTGRYIY